MLDSFEIEKLIKEASVVELKANIKKQKEILEKAEEERNRLKAELAKTERDFKIAERLVYIMVQLVDILEEED